MSRRKLREEIEVHPEELMTVAPLLVEGVYQTAIYLACWPFLGTNRGNEFICCLKRTDQKVKPHRLNLRAWEREENHIRRIRQWLRENPLELDPEDAPVMTLFPRKEHLWTAVLRTWHRDEIDLLTGTYGPLGDYNDKVPGSPFNWDEVKRPRAMGVSLDRVGGAA